MEGNLDLGQLGRDRLDNLCKVIKHLVIDKNIKFDYIIAAGNSGISMAQITLLIYDALKITRPNLIKIPFFRYYPGHNDDKAFLFPNIVYKEELKKQLVLDSVADLNILFVDDEIGQGITALGVLDLIKESLTELKYSKRLSYFIVAEDQGFQSPKDEALIYFYAIGKEVEGYNNLIFCMIPSDLEYPIVDKLGDDTKLPFHQRANLLLDLPIKYFNNGNPIFSNKLLEEAKMEIPEFEKYQKRFEEFLNTEIIKYLS